MTALPSIADLASSGTTEGAFQQALTDLRNFFLEIPGGGPTQSATLAGHAATPSAAAFLIVDTQGAASTDSLSNLIPTNVRDGYVLTVGAADPSRVVVLKHLQGGAGQLRLAGAGDLVLDQPTRWVSFRYKAATQEWVEWSRSWQPRQSPVVVFSTATTVALKDWASLFVFNGSANANLSLPAASTVPDGYTIDVKNLGTNSASVLVIPSGADTIDGNTSLPVTPGSDFGLVRSATGWRVKGVGANTANHGQCRLSLSGGQLKLMPFNGNKLIVAGVQSVLPPAGVSLAPGSSPNVTVSTIAVNANVATVVTQTAHGRSVGETVTITGASTVIEALGNWVVASVPSSTSFTFGLTRANIGAVAETSATVAPVFFIYATALNGVVNALVMDPRGHITDANGVEVLNGDGTKTLVGMAKNSGGNWVDTSTQRYVASYFNRPARRLIGSTLSGVSATSSAAFAELSSTLRVNALVWADEAIQLNLSCWASSDTANALTQASISRDRGAANLIGAPASGQNPNTGGFQNLAVSTTDGLLSEGFHFWTPSTVVSTGSVGSFTANLTGLMIGG